jgi:hypothetical protein
VEHLIAMSTPNPSAQPMVPAKTPAWVWIVVAVAILGFLVFVGVALTVPKLIDRQMLVREQTAIREIKTIHQAQTEYNAIYGKYADSLMALGPPPSGAAGPTAADLIPKNLADGKVTGYVYTVGIAPNGYSVNANPETFGTTGRRTFFSDQTLTIRSNWSKEPANVNSPELN